MPTSEPIVAVRPFSTLSPRLHGGDAHANRVVSVSEIETNQTLKRILFG